MTPHWLQPPPLPQVLSAPESGRVLVIAPHADDEIIGCGGAMALHREQGDEVTVLILTSGVNGDPERHWSVEEYVALRQREARAGGAALGVQDYRFWDFPDSMNLTEGDVIMVAARVHAFLKELRPAVVYYPWAGEAHSDHWYGSLAVRRALPFLPFVVSAYGFEVWTPCVPDCILDVSAVYDAKVEALRAHESQLRFTDHISKTLGMNAHRSIYLADDATHGEAYVHMRCGG